MTRVYNFSAGPAMLPTAVLKKAQSALLNYKGKGMSIIEMSHRSADFLEVYENSLASLRSLANIPEDFDILYMTGGASSQFAFVPLNLSSEASTAAYVNTGIWSQKAIKEARIQKLDVHIAGSSEDQNFSYIPSALDLPKKADYLYITSNNTIFGTQYKKQPAPGSCKLVIDMSSDFLSAPIDWSNTILAFAGAQKNAGPAGLCVVILNNECYAREREDTPTLFRYSTFAKSQSMHNTPPTFQIYIFSLVLEWLAEQGGLTSIAGRNSRKAQLIYDVIDKYPDFYIGHADKEHRSLMNITWNFADKQYEAPFLAGAEARSMFALKGHRSVGGLRASIYNAMEHKACQALADYMEEFYLQQKG